MRDAKQRLRPLDHVDPPEVWHRATSMQPLGDVPDPIDQPSVPRRVAAGVVAFAVFAGAVALALGAFDRAEPSTAIGATPAPAAVEVTLEAGDTEPSAHLAFGDRTIEGAGSSFCWDQGNASMCADVALPPIPGEVLRIDPSQPLTVGGDAETVTVDLLAYPMEAIELLDHIALREGAATLPSEAGTYILGFNASWPQGERTFYFAIEVVGADASPTDEPSEEPPVVGLEPIEVISPARGDDVTSPVTVTGTADVFEGTVQIWVIDQTNNVIASTFTTATCGSGCRGEFSVEVPYSVGSTQSGEILVFEESAEDGKRLHMVRIPVTLHPGPQDPVAAAVEGVWTDADGTPLPDGTDRSNDFGLTLHVMEGPDHCGWTSVTFLNLAWPIGSQTEGGGRLRQYIRDPQGVLSDFQVAPLSADGPFPADASPTGYHRGSWELWTAPSDVDDAVYLVNGDPFTVGTWERWPRSAEMIGCI